MMRSVYLKTLYDKRYFILGWFLGLAGLGALMASFYPAMRQEDVFGALIDNMPEAFKGLVGSLSDLSQFDTYMASQLFDIRLPLIAGIMGIILGLNLSIADEEKGELRTVLSLPVSRLKLLVQKWLAMVTILLLVTGGIAAGVYAVLPFLEDASIDGEDMLALLGASWLIMITFGTIPFSIGFLSGRRALATGLSILTVIGSFILSTFGQAVDWLEPYEKLSLLHYFPAVDIVKAGIEPYNIAVFGGITIVLLIVSLIVFRRRDVA